MAGINIPVMYQLGYNCIGCLKGSMGYWNKIRIDFPDMFKERAEDERLIGAKNRRNSLWFSFY